MAAVCLISVFGTWAVVHQSATDIATTTRHDVIAAHVRSLLQNSTIQVPSSDSHTVRPWFNGKVEIPGAVAVGVVFRRFLGALGFLVLLHLALGLGLFAAGHTPFVQRSLFEGARLSAYLMPYLVVVLPNLSAQRVFLARGGPLFAGW